MPTKKKPAKKSTTKKRASKKSPKRRRKSPKGHGHHLDRAHSCVMKALPHVTRADLEVIKRLARAVEHADENARGAKVG